LGEQLPIPPAPGRGEVKIRVASVGLNPIDYKIPELPLVSWVKKATPVGVEAAGEVVEVGPGVNNLRVGDKIYGGCAGGGLGEFAKCKEAEIAKLPDSLDLKLAGGYAAILLTAMQSLRAGGLCLPGAGNPISTHVTDASKRVLILGASGGVGHVAVQIAKKISGVGFVSGVCSSRNADFVKTMGADQVVDYTAENFRLSDYCSEHKFDLVFDAVSNPKFSYEDEARRCLTSASAGKYIAINTANFSDWPRAMAAQFTGWKFVQRANFDLIMCKFDRRDLDAISEWLNDGRVQVRVAKTVPFTEEGVREGFAQLKTERTVGKIVVQMSL
jgi:NADPH:quinone reductase-like Zn-dependent oxidoreductase